jgi:hypothetical protein
VEEKAEVKAVYVDHYRFLLPEAATLVPTELQVPVFVEPMLLVSHRNIVQNVYL